MKKLSVFTFIFVSYAGIGQVTTKLEKDLSVQISREQPFLVQPVDRIVFKRPVVVKDTRMDSVSMYLIFDEFELMDTQELKANNRYDEIQQSNTFYEFRNGNNANSPASINQSKLYSDDVGFTLKNGYLKNTYGNTPLDNSVGVNRQNQILSATNNDVVLLHEPYPEQRIDLRTFFQNQLVLPCDPKVIYDEQTDRFMLFAQECGNPEGYTKPRVCLAVSSSSDIYAKWNYYIITGFEGFMFDYPRVAITKNDIIITGTEFHTNNGLSNAAIYQMDREEVMAGEEIVVAAWDFRDAKNCFLLPISSYELKSSAYDKPLIMGIEWTERGSNCWLYEITGSVDDFDPLIATYRFKQDYGIEFFGIAQQKGGSQVDNLDLRLMDGFRIGNDIVYVNVVGNTTFHSKIRINRLALNVENEEIRAVTHSSREIGDEPQTSYMFPSASWLKKGDSIKVVVYYGGSSSQSYVQSYCAVCDMNLTCGDEVIVDAANGKLTQFDSSKNCYRWGDYTTISRHPNGDQLIMSGSSVNTRGDFGAQMPQLETILHQFSFKQIPSLFSIKDIKTFHVSDSIGFEGIIEKFKIKLYHANGELVKFKVDGIDLNHERLILSIDSLEGIDRLELKRKGRETIEYELAPN